MLESNNNIFQKLNQKENYMPKELAFILNVHYNTILDWINKGKLPAAKNGRILNINKIDIIKFIEINTRNKIKSIINFNCETPIYIDEELVNEILCICNKLSSKHNILLNYEINLKHKKKETDKNIY